MRTLLFLVLALLYISASGCKGKSPLDQAAVVCIDVPETNEELWQACEDHLSLIEYLNIQWDTIVLIGEDNKMSAVVEESSRYVIAVYTNQIRTSAADRVRVSSELRSYVEEIESDEDFAARYNY